MKAEDKQALTELVSQVLAYYRQPVSEFTLSVWWSACQPYSLEQIRKAMTAHATNPDGGQFAPKVADLVRILEGTHTDRAMLAWGKVHEAMSAVGAYQDVVFDDPAIHAVLEDLGGWPKVCRSELKDLSYLQKRFCDGHKAYTGRGTFPYPAPPDGRPLAGPRVRIQGHPPAASGAGGRFGACCAGVPGWLERREDGHRVHGPGCRARGVQRHPEAVGMTHTYAMKRLLEHGALTLSQLVDITGWPYSSVQAAISRLMEAGVVTAVSCGRHRNKYGLAE
jgi:hypothetical protein